MDINSIELFLKSSQDIEDSEFEVSYSELMKMLAYLLDEIKLLNSQIKLTQIEYYNIKSTLEPTEEKVVSRLKCTYESGLYNED